MISPLILLSLSALASAHTAAYGPGLYCKYGNKPGVPDMNTNIIVNPLYKLSLQDLWFQHDRGCDVVPPPDGEFLEVPAGGSLTVELAHNIGQTTLAFGGQYVSDWPDGKNHTEPWNTGEACLGGPNGDGALHTESHDTAAGTAFAISYHSKISEVTLDNLVVFSVAPKTPWYRITSYPVPQALPACPDDGCTCAWLWVPDGCGIPNMYMHGFKCKVTGATSTVPIGKAQAPVYCEGNPDSCVKGPKQMIVWNQLQDNIVVPGGKSPGYNEKCGYLPGAQNDIFQPGSADNSTVVPTPPSPPSQPSTLLTSASPTLQTTDAADALPYVGSTSTPTRSAVYMGQTPACKI